MRTPDRPNLKPIWIFSFLSLTFVLIGDSGFGLQAVTPEGNGVNSPDQLRQPFDQIVAVVNDRTVLLSEIDALVRTQILSLYDQVYQLRLKALDRLITDLIFQEEAKRLGISFEEFYSQAASSAETAGQENLLDFNLTGQMPNGGLSLDRVEAALRLRSIQSQRRRAEAVQQRKNLLFKQAAIRTFLTPERLIGTRVDEDDDAVRGAAEAAVTIIEFGDFHCHFCRKVKPILVSCLRNTCTFASGGCGRSLRRSSLTTAEVACLLAP